MPDSSVTKEPCTHLWVSRDNQGISHKLSDTNARDILTMHALRWLAREASGDGWLAVYCEPDVEWAKWQICQCFDMVEKDLAKESDLLDAIVEAGKAVAA